MRLKRPCRHQKDLFACDHWATRTFFSPQIDDGQQQQEEEDWATR
jgi:hypothetical protein